MAWRDLLKLAWRNLWRNRRRTVLTLSAMVLASSLLILILAISEGMFEDLLRSTTRQYTGQAVVCGEAYRRDDDFYTFVRQPGRVAAVLAAVPGVTGASPRLRVWGLVSRADASVAAEILGVDWAGERLVTDLPASMVAGGWGDDAGGPGVVIGRGLAGKLKAGLGDELVLVTQAADGSIGNDLFLVQGIFATGDAGRDNHLAICGRGRLGEMTAAPGMAHEVVLSVQDPHRAPEVAAAAERAVRPLQEDLRALPWQRLLPILAQSLELFDTSMYITTAILYLAAGMVVVNTLLMTFYERLREFGLLMAIGMTPGGIRGLMAAEALLLGLVAAALGSAAGVAASLLLDAHPLDISAWMRPVSFAGGSVLPLLRAALKPRDVLVPFLGLVLVSLAAVIPPLQRGGSRPPAQELQRSGAWGG
jgi:ABC-type lipoprotein release transport system permease subunit